MARDALKIAQSEADGEAQDKKAARAAVLGMRAAELAKKADEHLAEVAATLTQCADLHKQVVKLGQISDIGSRRLANPRVVEQALIRAGLKQFIPSIGAAIAGPPRALADSYRALFPYAGRDTGEAA